MRGTIIAYDTKTGTGTLRSRQGDVYPFTRAALPRRTKIPIPDAPVVFRLKDGKLHRAIVFVRYNRWTGPLNQEIAKGLFHFLAELLIRLPFACFE